MKTISILLVLAFFSLQQLTAQTDGKKKKGEDPDWSSFIVPGVGYSFYIPLDYKNLGYFHGVTTEFVWYTASRFTYKGPCNWRIYTRVSILQSTKQGIGGMINYVMGGHFSFENKVSRKFLIPFFGLEFGGLNQRDLKGGFQIGPSLGIQLISTRFASLQVQGGYNYSTRAFDRLSGGMFNATLNIFFW